MFGLRFDGRFLTGQPHIIWWNTPSASVSPWAPPSQSRSSDGLYLLMEIDAGGSGSSPPPPPFVHQTCPHLFFFPGLMCWFSPPGASGWAVSCLLTTPAPTSSLFPEKTDPLLQTAALTARRGEMESSHPLLQAVLYSNCLHADAAHSADGLALCWSRKARWWVWCRVCF